MHLTQQQVADLANVSTGTVANIESGRTVPQATKLRGVMQVLGINEDGTLSYPKDVQVLLDVIGAWLTKMPDSDRQDAIRVITELIFGDSWDSRRRSAGGRGS
jgi:transcriptional regulator with XRE-family HTH domain